MNKLLDENQSQDCATTSENNSISATKDQLHYFIEQLPCERIPILRVGLLPMSYCSHTTYRITLMRITGVCTFGRFLRRDLLNKILNKGLLIRFNTVQCRLLFLQKDGVRMFDDERSLVMRLLLFSSGGCHRPVKKVKQDVCSSRAFKLLVRPF